MKTLNSMKMHFNVLNIYKYTNRKRERNVHIFFFRNYYHNNKKWQCDEKKKNYRAVE